MDPTGQCVQPIMLQLRAMSHLSNRSPTALASVHPARIDARTSMANSPENNPSYERILGAGKALFIEQGFPETSMEAIAQRANVVRATVYNNFKDKEAILAEIMRRYFEGYV